MNCSKQNLADKGAVYTTRVRCFKCLQTCCMCTDWFDSTLVRMYVQLHELQQVNLADKGTMYTTRLSYFTCLLDVHRLV
jgi:hypothetical protein